MRPPEHKCSIGECPVRWFNALYLYMVAVPKGLMMARWLAAAALCVLACGCGSAVAPAAPAPHGHAVSLFGRHAAMPPLRVITAAQAHAEHLYRMDSSPGPTYDHGRLLGLAVSGPGCEQALAATVRETAATVQVIVYGNPSPQGGGCPADLITTTVSVRLPRPLAGRATRS
jgi:hypothetical protein